MKKVGLIIFVALLIPIFVACNNNTHNELKPTKDATEKALGFKIEKIVLSKGYQTLEPKVEIVTKNNDTKLSISFGLIECSGITIDNITKKDNVVNIYANRLLEEDKTQLSIPQATVLLDKKLDDKANNYQFNIINQNYSPIELKFGKSQTLDKIYSHFKIEPNSIPNVRLIRHKDSFIWDIVFHNIFDKGNFSTPLINLNVKADAITGEIVYSDKNVVSDYIDDGVILDYVPKKYLLYKQEQIVNDKTVNLLWLYNIDKKEKEQIYETNDSIFFAKFSPDHKNISLIENDNEMSDIYLINIKEKLTSRLTPAGYNQIWNMKWNDENKIYFVNNDTENRSTLFLYNVEEKNMEEVFKLPVKISKFDVQDEQIVFTEYEDKNINQNIFITKDGLTLEKIDEGHNVSFLDNDTVIFLKNSSAKNEDRLCLYDIKNKSMKLPTNVNVKNYLKYKDDKLFLIEKSGSEYDYTLLSCNIHDGSVHRIAKINGENIYYDEELNKGYISLTPPLENKKRHIIYSIDLNQMKFVDNN